MNLLSRFAAGRTRVLLATPAAENPLAARLS
jgi:hypothetical protein